MSKENTALPTMAEFKERVLAASAAGLFPADGVKEGDRGPSCSYLTKDNKKCAIGLLLPEDVARSLDTRGKGSTVSVTEVWRVVSLYAPKGFTQEHASQLQRCHDDIALNIRGTGKPWPHEQFELQVNHIFKDAEAAASASS